MPEVVLTLITPTYNRRSCLLQTLECYRKQARPEVELILVDDGSSDGTLELVQELHPEIVTLRSDTRRGPSVARNLAMTVAKGRYILPLDSDCFLTPGCLEFLVDFLAERATGIYLFPCQSWPGGRLSTTEDRQHVVSLEQLLLKTLGEVIPALPLDLLRSSGYQFPEHFAGGEPYLLLQLRLEMEATFVPKVVLEYRTDTPMRISSPEYQVSYPEEIAEVLEATLPFYQFCHSPRARLHHSFTMEKIGIYRLLAGQRRHGLSFLKAALQRGRMSAALFGLGSLLPRWLLVRLFLVARRLKASSE